MNVKKRTYKLYMADILYAITKIESYIRGLDALIQNEMIIDVKNRIHTRR